MTHIYLTDRSIIASAVEYWNWVVQPKLNNYILNAYSVLDTANLLETHAASLVIKLSKPIVNQLFTKIVCYQAFISCSEIVGSAPSDIPLNRWLIKARSRSLHFNFNILMSLAVMHRISIRNLRVLFAKVFHDFAKT